MLFYSPAVLRAMAEICRAHEVLFIADEVMTGWVAPARCWPANKPKWCPTSSALPKA
jgi:adenosylmethionine-8-amino-7-oxononanoate aminotransferase